MITEKEQKIVDAVNHLGAELTKDNCDILKNDVFLFIVDRVINSYITATSKMPILEYVCTIEEFNQCVKEMSLNGDSRNFEIYSSRNSLLKDDGSLTKENSDYSYYTKESKMFDRGDKVIVNEKEYTFGCVSPLNGGCCVLFNENGDYGSFLFDAVKAKPKAEK